MQAKRASSVGVALTALLLTSLFLGACSSAPHIDSDVAFEYRSGVELGPFHRGWSRTWVGRRIDRPRVIAHEIQIQADLAGPLVRMPHSDLRAKVGELVCPPADAEIWSHLVPGQDIEVELGTRKNGPFATVSCRKAVF